MQSLLFESFNSNWSNFAEWTNDVKVFFQAENIAKTISKEEILVQEQLTPATKWHTLMILRRHLDHALQIRYLHTKDPAELWAKLQTRFDHQQMLYMPQTRSDWTNLRVLNFPNFSAFDKELHQITSQLWMCGYVITNDELIEKTLLKFSPATAIFSQ